MSLLYDLTDGSRTEFVAVASLAQQLRISVDDVGKIVEYLEGEGLISDVAGRISMTHDGAKEVERSVLRPDEETEHFPSISNVINVHAMYGSQIQQGTLMSTQALATVESDTAAKIAALVGEILEDVVPYLDLPDDDKRELLAELGSVKSQAGSSRPKAQVIEAGISRASVLLGQASVVTGSVVKLAEYVQRLHDILPGV